MKGELFFAFSLENGHKKQFQMIDVYPIPLQENYFRNQKMSKKIEHRIATTTVLQYTLGVIHIKPK